MTGRTLTLTVLVAVCISAPPALTAESAHGAARFDLGEAKRFMILTPGALEVGGGSNLFTGDVGASTVGGGGGSNVYTGEIISDPDILALAIADAVPVSSALAELPADIVLDLAPRYLELSTPHQGLTVISLVSLEEPVFGFDLTVEGGPDDTVVLNVWCSEAPGEPLRCCTRTAGGLPPNRLIANYVEAPLVDVGSGSHRVHGTHLVLAGSVIWGSGSWGLDGAIITTGDMYIGGGSNVYNHFPFDATGVTVVEQRSWSAVKALFR